MNNEQTKALKDYIKGLEAQIETTEILEVNIEMGIKDLQKARAKNKGIRELIEKLKEGLN